MAVLCKNSKNCFDRNRFSGTGFSYNRQCLTFHQVKVDITNRMNRTCERLKGNRKIFYT